MTLIGKAGDESDFREPHIRAGQELSCPLNPALQDVAVRRDAYRQSDNPATWASASFVMVLVEMRDDVLEERGA
jgi:hypothetical protein